MDSNLLAALHALAVPSLLEAIDEVLAEFSDPQRHVIERRLLRMPPQGGALVGKEIGVSRQRVSQIEGKCVDRLNGLVAANASLQMYSAAIDYLSPPALHLDDLTLLATRATFGDESRVTLAVGVCAWLLKRDRVDDWFVSPSEKARFEALADTLRTAAPGALSVADTLARSICGDFFADDISMERRLRELGFSPFLGEWLLSTAGRARLQLVLTKSDHPMTVSQIAENAGITAGYAMNILREEPIFVRADRHRYWLQDRVANPYDGIVAEMEQYLERHDGPVSLDDLARDLADEFGVAESSVRIYAQTPNFLLGSDGAISKANRIVFDAAPPGSVSGAVLTQKGWGQWLHLKETNFQGYSLLVSPHVAYANGIRPSDSLRVPVNETACEASVIWRLTSATGLVDVGRVRQTLRDLGMRPGDRICVVPGRDEVWLLAVSQVEAPAAAPAGELSADAEVEDAGDDLLPANPVLARLRRRTVT